MMKKIMIGVTIDDSLQFHEGLPAVLVEDGWEVHVVATPGRRLEALARIAGVVTHAIPMERAPHPLRDLVALLKWISVMRRVTPDVALIGTPKAALLGTFAGRLIGVPRRIYMLHGLRYETAGGTARWVLKSAEKAICRWATEVIAVSPSLRALAVDERLAPAERVRVIGAGSCNGVDVGYHQRVKADSSASRRVREQFGLRADLPVIGFVGRLTYDKGLPELASALRILRERDVHIQMLVVGGVDDSTGHEALLALKSSGQVVVPVGYQPDPAPFFSVMDVFCFPSRREGLGNVVLEAMSSSVPVVVSDATGLIDLVEPGYTGYRVARGDAFGLADALIRTLSSPESSSRFAQNALEMVTERYERGIVLELLRIDLNAKKDDRVG